MKLKIILALALSFISIQALAIEGTGFKIINEKTTHSSGFKGGFQQMSQKKRTTSGYVSTMAWAYNSEGKPREYIKIQGDHNVSISNYSNKTQRYTYTYVLSCESAYEQFDRTIDVYPNGNFSDSSHSYGSIQEEIGGTFRINVLTKVTGAELSSHEANAILRVR